MSYKTSIHESRIETEVNTANTVKSTSTDDKIW